MIPNSDPEGRIFQSAPNIYDRFSFLYTFDLQLLNLTKESPLCESHSHTLTSAILKVDVVCDVNFNVLAIELRDLLYNQCIDNTCCYSFFFIRPTGRIRVCKIRFVSTGENRGKPCLVCKKK